MEPTTLVDVSNCGYEAQSTQHTRLAPGKRWTPYVFEYRGFFTPLDMTVGAGWRMLAAQGLQARAPNSDGADAR
jgi:hypothetical protein